MPRTMKARDSYPALKITLSDANGTVDLTNALGAIKVFIAPPGQTLITLTGTKRTPQSGADKGVIDAPFTTTTFTSATLGALPANAIPTEVQVAWDVGATQVTTFPGSGYEAITIEADLGT